MEDGTDVRIERLIEAGVMAGCYWRQERLAAHPDAKKAWAALALKRRGEGAVLMDEISADAGLRAQASATMPNRQTR